MHSSQCKTMNAIICRLYFIINTFEYPKFFIKLFYNCFKYLKNFLIIIFLVKVFLRTVFKFIQIREKLFQFKSFFFLNCSSNQASPLILFRCGERNQISLRLLRRIRWIGQFMCNKIFILGKIVAITIQLLFELVRGH